MLPRNSLNESKSQILGENLNHQNLDFGNGRRADLDELRPIEEIPHPYQQVFARYPGFNIIQSKILDDILDTDNSVVVSAPTGSGKTVIFELAVVRLLIIFEKTQSSNNFKIVYICPMKALCEERVVDWHKKFSSFGINCISVTGDSDDFEFQDLLNHNLIITTPEKWDCLTRKWRDNRNLMELIKLFMIDEVHLLHEENRGSTLETIVCRMKTIEETIISHTNDHSNHKIRFVAVSATVSNIEDVAEWIGSSSNVKCYKFSDEYRPVKLTKIVLGYSSTPYKSHFKFDLALNYKLQLLMMHYSHGKPTLIFCSTRKIVEMTAKHILQHLTINLKPEQKQKLIQVAGGITDAKVKATLVHGVGYHHAGMLPETRRAVEQLFRNSELPILVTTSTLATGVNLPAHLVIVKSTKCYINGEFRDYTETALLQMIGRAGRPQYDTEATALILTTLKDKEKFEKMIGGLEPIESNLHRHLTEHLNAEVVLQTITDLDVAMRWLSSTFLYIRASKNPRHYGLTGDASAIDRRLLEMCQIELNKLIKAEMITIDQDVLLKATPTGTAMAKYYLAFETMKLFTQIGGGEILQQILALISKCHEFSMMYLRVNDKKCLNLLNNCRNRQTIRFPLNGKIKTLDMKINCIIQAVLGCLDICDHSILTEALKIMRNGERIVKCLIEYLESKDRCYQALLSTIILAKCFHVKLWENSPYVSKQLSGIGNVMSSQLVTAGKTSFQLLAECDPREIELLINKKPPMGNKVLEQIQHLPKYKISLGLEEKNVKLIVSLENMTDLQEFSTVNLNSLMYLLVGDSCNNILLYEKFCHSYMVENPTVIRLIKINVDKNLEDIEAHFISDDWVGIDCNARLELKPKQNSHEKKGKMATPKKNKKDDITYMQKFMEIYTRCKRNTQATPVSTSEEDQKKKKQDRSNVTIQSQIRIFPASDNVKMSEYAKSVAGVDSNEEINTESNRTCLEDTFYSSSAFVSNEQERDFEDAKSVAHKFQFSPKKKLSRKCPSNSVETPKEDKQKTNSRITWRSPLTYSPPVKFSPKINYPVSSNLDHESLLASRGSSSTSAQETVKTPVKLSTSVTCRTPVRLNSSQSKAFFPLTDKDYADSVIDESNDSRNNILEKVGDIASTSFLENVGLLTPRVREKSLNQIKTPNQYYTQLLSHSHVQKDSLEDKEFCAAKSNIGRNVNKSDVTRSGAYSRKDSDVQEVSAGVAQFSSTTPKSNSRLNDSFGSAVTIGRRGSLNKMEHNSGAQSRNVEEDNFIQRFNKQQTYQSQQNNHSPCQSRYFTNQNNRIDKNDEIGSKENMPSKRVCLDRLNKSQKHNSVISHDRDQKISFSENSGFLSDQALVERFSSQKRNFDSNYSLDKVVRNESDSVRQVNSVYEPVFKNSQRFSEKDEDVFADDPFDDSFDLAISGYQTPPELAQNSKVMTRRNSSNSVLQRDNRTNVECRDEDSFDSLMADYKLPPQLSQVVNNNRRLLSENGDFSSVRYHDGGGMQKRNEVPSRDSLDPEETKYQILSQACQIANQNRLISRKNSCNNIFTKNFDKNPYGYVNYETENRLNFTHNQGLPRSSRYTDQYQNIQAFGAPLEENFLHSGYQKIPQIYNRGQGPDPASPGLSLGANNSFIMSHHSGNSQQSFKSNRDVDYCQNRNRNRYHPYTSQRNHYEDLDGYQYIRRITETDNDPFDYRNTSMSSNYIPRRNFNPLRHNSYSNKICIPSRNDVSYGHDISLVGEPERRAYDISYSPQYVPRENFTPEPYFSPRPGRNDYFSPNYPYSYGNSGDKDYLMQKFLTTIDPDQEHPNIFS